MLSSSSFVLFGGFRFGFSKDFLTANAVNPPVDSDDQPVTNHAGTPSFSVQFEWVKNKRGPQDILRNIQSATFSKATLPESIKRPEIAPFRKAWTALHVPELSHTA